MKFFFYSRYEGGWFYKENNKLRDWKKIFTLHIPPLDLHTLMTFFSFKFWFVRLLALRPLLAYCASLG
jgi:hypothetical protein